MAARGAKAEKVKGLRDRAAFNAGCAYEALKAFEKNLEELRALGDGRLEPFILRLYPLSVGLHSMRNELAFRVFKFVE